MLAKEQTKIWQCLQAFFSDVTDRKKVIDFLLVFILICHCQYCILLGKAYRKVCFFVLLFLFLRWTASFVNFNLYFAKAGNSPSMLVKH